MTNTVSRLIIFAYFSLFAAENVFTAENSITVASAVSLSNEPSVKLYSNFITKKEAEHLIHLAKDRLKPSTVQVKGQKIQHPQRTSTSAYLKKSEDTIVKSIEQRACRLVNCTESHMEPLQIVHYSKGQKYSAHHDYFTPEELQHQKSQRIHTFLVYLNNVAPEHGGKTIFPALNIAIAPKLGVAVYFNDADEAGNIKPKTLHGGAEIKTESIEKWACNIWIRNKPYVALTPSTPTALSPVKAPRRKEGKSNT